MKISSSYRAMHAKNILCTYRRNYFHFFTNQIQKKETTRRTSESFRLSNSLWPDHFQNLPFQFKKMRKDDKKNCESKTKNYRRNFCRRVHRIFCNWILKQDFFQKIFQLRAKVSAWPQLYEVKATTTFLKNF